MLRRKSNQSVSLTWAHSINPVVLYRRAGLGFLIQYLRDFLAAVIDQDVACKTQATLNSITPGMLMRVLVNGNFLAKLKTNVGYTKISQSTQNFVQRLLRTYHFSFLFFLIATMFSSAGMLLAEVIFLFRSPPLYVLFVR